MRFLFFGKEYKSASREFDETEGVDGTKRTKMLIVHLHQPSKCHLRSSANALTHAILGPTGKHSDLEAECL